MGTDCKFVGNMSTLVQIQLGPIIRQSAVRYYNPLSFRNTGYGRIKKNPNFCYIPSFPWDCSSIGQSTALSRRKLRVRAPSVPTDLINTLIQLSLFCERWDRGQGRISFPRGIFFSFRISHQTNRGKFSLLQRVPIDGKKIYVD